MTIVQKPPSWVVKVSTHLHQTLEACPGGTVVRIQVFDERAEPRVGDLIVWLGFIALVAANVRMGPRLRLAGGDALQLFDLGDENAIKLCLGPSTHNERLSRSAGC